MTFPSSRLQKCVFRGREIYIKRDDELHIDFSGNKARKLHWFLNQDFSHIKRVISYGSNQSNAMYSISVLARMRGWEFLYICSHVPSFLRDNPVGNYKYALENGMQVIISKNASQEIHSYNSISDLTIEEGGRQQEAEFGIKILAKELVMDFKRYGIENPYIFLPSGTGTTALFLHKNLPFRVYTCSAVGDDDYLLRQFKELANDSFPIVLNADKKYHFGKLYLELYELWVELKNSMGVVFDLLYDPVGWQKLLLHIDSIKGVPIYIHQGGIIGNESMEKRYKYKYGNIKL